MYILRQRPLSNHRSSFSLTISSAHPQVLLQLTRVLCPTYESAPAAMAASRNMALLGLLMAFVMCGSASAASTVAPVETMKLGGLVNLKLLHLKLKIILLGHYSPTEVVKVVVTGASTQVVPYKFADGDYRKEKTISVAVSITALAPLYITVTITIGDHRKAVKVPLAKLGPGLDVLGGVTGIVSGVLYVVKDTVGGILLKNPDTHYETPIFSDYLP